MHYPVCKFAPLTQALCNLFKHYDGRTIHGRASATNISGIFRCPLLRPQLRPVWILPVTNVAIPGQCPRTTRLPAPMHTAFARRIVGGAKHLGRSQGLRKNWLQCRQIGHQFDVALGCGKHYQNQHTLHSHQTLSHIRNDNLHGQRLAWLDPRYYATMWTPSKRSASLAGPLQRSIWRSAPKSPQALWI